MFDRYAGRLARARELTAARGAAAALITGLVNVRYLTGLASSNAALLIPADGDPVLATDSRYALAASNAGCNHAIFFIETLHIVQYLHR